MPKAPPAATLTIGRLARAAGVGVETVRYYQRRKLLPVPPARGAYRHYPAELVDRLRFIKRTQALGFTLQEIGELLRLQDGTDRRSIRAVASRRLQQVEENLADLRRMQRALKAMLVHCEHTNLDAPCPIIESLSRGKP